jgi:hypothetical protein
VVWDDWPAGESRGRVFSFVLDPVGAASPAAAVSAAAVPVGGRVPVATPNAASAPGVDAEEPRVVARPAATGWRGSSTLPPAPVAASHPAHAAPVPARAASAASAGRSRIYDPGEGEAEAPAADTRPSSSASYGARYIEVVALDGAGRAAGQVRRLSTEQARVIGYDLSTTAAGNAWLVWRQDAPSPGAAGGRVLMAEVGKDGAHAVLPVREEDVGSGEPSWLGAGSAPVPWLTFPDQRDRTLLLPVEYPLPIAPPLVLDAELGSASALAATGGQVLFARPRGRALELFVASCSAPPRPLATGRDGG